MSQVKELLTKEIQGLLDAEKQLTTALPKMAEAAKHPKLQEAFQKHFMQTQEHVERLRAALSLIGEEPGAEPCRAMQGLIEEVEKMISESTERDPIAADLALIATAQKVEHYEIASYGTARVLARQLGSLDCARLLSQTLGEEERADFLLSAISDPLLQELTLGDVGAEVNLDNVGKMGAAGRKKVSKQERGAA
jgi:Mn-containing catalase